MATEPGPGALRSGAFEDLRRIWRIDDTTLDRLKDLRPITDEVLFRLDERFYESLFTEEPVRLLMRDQTVRRRAISAMAGHWRDLLSGELKDETLLRAIIVGKRHLELGVSEQYFTIANQQVLNRLIEALIEAAVPELSLAVDAVVRMVMLNVFVSTTSQAKAGSDACLAVEVQRETRHLRDDLQALEALAYVDALTGLFNRRYFDQALAAAIAHGLRHEEPLCLIMVDIDRFKRVNDTHGHLVGDLALRALAASMAGVVRRDDVLVRFGGEEFAVILPATTMHEAILCAERLRFAAEALSVGVEGGRFLRLTLSLGVAAFKAAETTDGLISGADGALYRAKDLGRNRVEQREASTDTIC